ncbi:helix-turn-helix domain-containing protein [Okeania sp. SIO2B3]|uniref:helix-turn-helix domain-containing protein n=1 Tax=Okeania sp. SIO2B3 TaxID=2607784 RepID=UPI0013C26D41|nr:helix-turn-helix domain-containing protein [Okeania sp. SIO2B3]NET45188.1 helix-turn-helix domain-containing protein [Okeania sp. SIO2B3]
MWGDIERCGNGAYDGTILNPMGLESTGKKSKKIRIYLSREQRQLLRQWIGVARSTYNRTVEYLQQPETKANWKAVKGGILNNTISQKLFYIFLSGGVWEWGSGGVLSIRIININ